MSRLRAMELVLEMQARTKEIQRLAAERHQLVGALRTAEGDEYRRLSTEFDRFGSLIAIALAESERIHDEIDRELEGADKDVQRTDE